MTTPQQHLTTLVDSINDLIEHAETLAEENQLEFTIKFKSHSNVNVDWTSSWASSYE